MSDDRVYMRDFVIDATNEWIKLKNGAFFLNKTDGLHFLFLNNRELLCDGKRASKLCREAGVKLKDVGPLRSILIHRTEEIVPTRYLTKGDGEGNAEWVKPAPGEFMRAPYDNEYAWLFGRGLSKILCYKHEVDLVAERVLGGDVEVKEIPVRIPYITRRKIQSNAIRLGPEAQWTTINPGTWLHCGSQTGTLHLKEDEIKCGGDMAKGICETEGLTFMALNIIRYRPAGVSQSNSSSE